MNTVSPHIRAFIAIPLPNEVKTRLKYLQSQLKMFGLKASWTGLEALHLTLVFLEKIEINQINRLTQCMARAAATIPVHTLCASGIGVFPSIKKARIIWSGTKGQADVLEMLVNRLSVHLFKDMGIKKENKKFCPHLTVARLKNPVPSEIMITLVQAFKDFRSENFLVSEISLFKSELTSSGATHKLIFSAPVGTSI